MTGLRPGLIAWSKQNDTIHVYTLFVHVSATSLCDADGILTIIFSVEDINGLSSHELNYSRSGLEFSCTMLYLFFIIIINIIT